MTIMFVFGKSKAAKELDTVILSMQLAFENNYKDNATANLKKFEQLLDTAITDGRLKEKEKEVYGQIKQQYRERLKNFDHKKPAQW